MTTDIHGSFDEPLAVNGLTSSGEVCEIAVDWSPAMRLQTFGCRLYLKTYFK